MQENTPHAESDDKIKELQKEVSLLRNQVEMLFEIGLSATEALQASIYGDSNKSNERLQHLVYQLRPLAQTLRGNKDG